MIYQFDINSPLHIFFNEDLNEQSETESVQIKKFSELLDKMDIQYIEIKYDLKQFISLLKSLHNELKIYVWIHPNIKMTHIERQHGYPPQIISDSLSKNHPNIHFKLISRQPPDSFLIRESPKIYPINVLYQLEENNILPQSISEIREIPAFGNIQKTKIDVDYAIITALYEEFEDVEKLFDWAEPYRTANKEYKRGYFKGKSEIKVVAAIPPKTGMVDSAIIATQMLEIFKPKYLLMSGVCGGKKGIKLGDIVLASNVFTFQKGKISDLKDEEGKNVEFFDDKKNRINLSEIYDGNGKSVEINVELFEKEGEGEEIDTLTRDFIEPALKKIYEGLNEHIKVEAEKINIHFEPMACSTMVINKIGFFDKRIKNIERKTAAVEMESYGVARACKFANDGKTKFVIFKSVMDNTVDKIDEFKKQAAYNSSHFLKQLLENDILK